MEKICSKLELTKEKCDILMDYMEKQGKVKKGKKPRKLSRWQQCISERRRGKPFDGKAIKELANKLNLRLFNVMSEHFETIREHIGGENIDDLFGIEREAIEFD